MRCRRLRILGLVLLLAILAVPAEAAAPPFLVRYSFDDGLTATGPDTFTVFRNAKGSVQLSTALKRWPEVDDLLVDLHTRWGDDPRYALASALIAAQRGDLGEARAWLDPAAGEALRREPPLARHSRRGERDERHRAPARFLPQGGRRPRSRHLLPAGLPHSGSPAGVAPPARSVVEDGRRYEGAWTPETKASIYHHLCALDFF